MDPDQLLQSLGLTLGLPNLRFDGNGCARIAIDGAPALNFERADGGLLHVYSVLGDIPPEGREALYEQMLQGNLFGASTSGASLALDTQLGEVMMCRTFVTEYTTTASFSAMIETFVAAAEDWQARLGSAPASAPATGRSGAASSPMMDHFLRG